MHFDDRLATVLRSRTGGEAMARIQYRQLLDLLGTMPVEANGPQVEAACDRLQELSSIVPAPVRAAILREPGIRLRNPRLVAMLAAGEANVAASAIHTAQLIEDEWIDLAPALPAAARSLVSQRRDIGTRAAVLFTRLGMAPLGLPSGEAVIHSVRLTPTGAVGEAANDQTPARSDSQRAGDIGAIVQRIEHFRKAREPGDADPAAQLQRDKAIERKALRLKAFNFATDAEGCIVWSDPGMAPMVVGLRLASHDMSAPASARASLALALRYRQPVRGLVMQLDGAPAIAGRWQIDAAPTFEPGTGAYRGHAGRMRREMALNAAPTDNEVDSKADLMRQLLHELRTPVNAIQGFSEVIQQQLFGPAPHEYRSLAAAVAGDAARVLAGLEDLERLARLESGRLTPETGESKLADLITAAVNQLRPFSEPRGSGFTVDFPADAVLSAALAPPEAERLVWRLLATLAAAAAPGEMLAISGTKSGQMAVISVVLPVSLASLNEEQFWHAIAAPAAKAVSAGIFGTGFSLRLARAEIEAAGGEIGRDDGRLVVKLPGLTCEETSHSEGLAQG
jgi:two-component system OmpR family sensor kinase